MAKQQLNGTQRKDIYSATETDTGKLWVDGRTIYRKVLRGQVNLSASSTNTIAHGISGLTTSWELISLMGGLKIGAASNNQANMNLFWHRETAGNWVNPTGMDATNLSFTASYAWGSSYYTVILEYVK